MTPARGATAGMATASLPTYDDVAAAAARIAGPRPPHAGADLAHRRRRSSARSVFFKCENFQRMGAFKFRGAFNALSRFDARAAARPASSPSRRATTRRRSRWRRALLGMPAVIVMPHDAPAAKVAATRGYGAEVVVYDRYTRGPRGDRPAARRRARHDADPALRPPGRDRRPGHGGEGADRGGRRARRAVRLPRRRRPALAARRWRRARWRRGARSTASSPRRATTASSRFAAGSDRAHRDAADDRRRRADAAPRRAHVPDHPARRRPTSSPPATRELVEAMRFFAERMKMVVEPTGCLGFAAARRDEGRARGPARRRDHQRRQRRPGALRGAGRRGIAEGIAAISTAGHQAGHLAITERPPYTDSACLQRQALEDGCIVQIATRRVADTVIASPVGRVDHRSAARSRRRCPARRDRRSGTE